MSIKKVYNKVFFVSFLFLSILNLSNLNAGNFENANDATSDFTCEANFSYSDYDGPLPVVGGITFENLSSGTYSHLAWDFGDGNIVSNENVTTHIYEESGSYEVSLSIWDNYAQQCFSTSTTIVEVWISDDPCDQLDCVWPGDTNADGISNLEDILNIGLEFGMTGPPRDSVCGGWFGHPAEDWNYETSDGLNLKHADCNGDGEINLSDLPFTSNLSDSYTQLENGVAVAESNGAPIKLQFNVDTVHITNSFEPTKITAALMLGSSDVVMEDVYGVVLYLEFPGVYVDTTSQIEIDYDENSFFGGVGEVITRAVDLSDDGQIDFAIARTDGENVSGHGRIATLSYIIDADIIDGRDEDEGQSFNVHVKVVKVIDKFGNELDISLSAEPASVFFVNNIVTSVVDPALSEKVKVYPNPVSDVLNIDLGDLNGELLELYDVLGKQVLSQKLQSDRMIELSVNSFEKGMYLMKIQTEQGIVSKRIVVK